MRFLCLLMLLTGTALAEDKPKAIELKVPPLPPSTDELLTADVSAAKWSPQDKLGAGVQSALIGYDPMSTDTTGWVKLPGGNKIVEHSATHHVHYVLIAGRGSFSIAGKARPIAAGSYTVVPSKTKHGFSCDKGAECLFVVRHSGPPDVNL